MTTIVAFNDARSNAFSSRALRTIDGLTEHDDVIVVDPGTGHALGAESSAPHVTHMPATPGALAALRARGDCVAWCFGSVAEPWLDLLNPTATVYDRTVQPLNPEAEAPEDRALLGRADLVISAVPGVCQATRKLHGNVVCIPDGVDPAFFSPFFAMKSHARVAEAASLHAALPLPRLAYHGDIDRSLDLDLILALAHADPAWHIVLAGAVRDVDVGRLRATKNISLLDPVPPGALPHMIAQCSVAILPFRKNHSAHFVNPSQALNYLSYGRAVVSTSATCAAELYGDGIDVADDPREFAAMCRARAYERPLQRRERVERASAVVERHSWAQATLSMRAALARTLGERRRRSASQGTSNPATV